MKYYAPLTVPSTTFLLLRYKEYTYIYIEREWKRNTTFEVQKQHSNSLGKSSSFSNFLSTFLLLSYKERWRKKKKGTEQWNSSKQKHRYEKASTARRKEENYFWNDTVYWTGQNWDSVLVIQADFWICATDKFDIGSLPTLKSLGHSLETAHLREIMNNI